MPGNTGVYNIRYPVDSDSFTAQSIRNMAEDIDAAIGLFNNQTYQTQTLMNGWQSGGGGQPKLLKTGRMVTFTAEIYKTTAGTAKQSFCSTIPVAFRPMQRIRDAVIATTSYDEATVAIVEISPDGIATMERWVARSATPGYHIALSWITA